MSQWTVPPPPPMPGSPNQRPIRGRKVAAGIGMAVGLHLLSVAASIVSVLVGSDSDAIGVAFGIGLISQAIVFVLCLTFGIIWLAKYDRGIGLGWLIGWAAGVLVLPVVGFGVCIWLIGQSGGAFG